MTTDILILGGGLSARMAASIAVKGGAKVTLVRDGGGASPFIHGICIPVHPEDSLELFISDTLKSGKYQNDPELVKTLCEGSLSLINRYPLDRDENGNISLLRPLGASVPRVAGIKSETGLSLMEKINEEGGFSELSNCRALQLIKENGRVIGAEIFDKKNKAWFTVYANATILATGGYGNVFPFSTNSSDIGGDGISMAYHAGCNLVDMEFIQFEPTAAVFPVPLLGKSVITTMMFEGAVFRNAQGNSFIENGKVDKDILSKAIYREILAGRGTEHGGVYYDATGVEKSILFSKYYSYVKRYANVGIDISRISMEVAPAPHTTLGGVQIDSQCKTGVNGLFACGEVTGGVHGANRLGGNAGLETIVFGEIAGKTALSYAQNLPSVSDFGNISDYSADSQSDISVLKDQVRSLAGQSLNVIRNRETMAAAKKQVTEILDSLSNMPKDYSVMRLENDAMTVSLALTAALERKGSIGCHERSDSISETQRYSLIQHQNITIRKKLLQ